MFLVVVSDGGDRGYWSWSFVVGDRWWVVVVGGGGGDGSGNRVGGGCCRG